MNYKQLLEQYMIFLVNREGSCFVDALGPIANYGEEEHMTEKEFKALGDIYFDLAKREGWEK